LAISESPRRVAAPREIAPARTVAWPLGRIARFAIAAMLALAFLSQGITAPFEKDEESRPAGLTRDVVQRGDWLVPRDDYGEASRKRRSRR
jgi:hypothetical protein